MPVRWTISSVAERAIDMGDSVEMVVCPKEHVYLDPGRATPECPNGKRYIRVSLYHTDRRQRTWALNIIRGVDFTPLDNDPEVINLFETEFDSISGTLDMTPSQLGWSASRLQRIRNRLAARGGDATGLNANAPIRLWLTRVGKLLDPNFNPDVMNVAGP